MDRRKPDRDYTPKLDGRGEAHLFVLACSEPPEGRSRWTYALLADCLVTLDDIEIGYAERLNRVSSPLSTS